MPHYEVDCPHCGARCMAATTVPLNELICWNCRRWVLPRQPDRSAATVGLIGGAAMGAGIGGPVGAIVGGILGALLGSGGRRRR